MLFSAMKKSASYKAFLNVVSYFFVLEPLKSVYFALKSPIVISIFAEFFMLL